MALAIHLLLSAMMAVVTNARISIPLTPRKLSTPISYQVSNTFVLAQSSSSSANEPIRLNLTNSLDRIYTGTIFIGTPLQQQFEVIFDTGSADLWVFSASHGCVVGQQCNDKTWQIDHCSSDDSNVCCFFDDIMNAYNSSASTSYQTYTGDVHDWEITYGKGSASGHLSTDSVTIGGLTANSLVFAEATFWSDLLISCEEPMSGILGFAMKAASDADNADTLIEALYNQNRISSKIFSMSIGDASQSSELIIGEPDTSKYKNDIVWGHVVQPVETGMWFTLLTGVLFSAERNLTTARADNSYVFLDVCVSNQPCLALVDTGSSYLVLPSTAYDQLLNYLDENLVSDDTQNCFLHGNDDDDSQKMFICEAGKYSMLKLPTLWFQLGGTAFPVTPEQYMLSGEDSCLSITVQNEKQSYDCLGVSAMDTMGEHTFILGDVFMRQYYVVFDEENYRIGVGSLHEVYPAIERPEIKNGWKYVEIVFMVIGAVGVLLCVALSCCWKWKRPQHSELWDRQRLIDDDNPQLENNGQVIAVEENANKNIDSSNATGVFCIDAAYVDAGDEQEQIRDVLKS